MKQYKVLRAEETWQRAGAYSVRVQGMNRRHHISLREEFDEHDGGESKYIVLLDDTYPVATCRFYELDKRSVLVGRVVVLPEYRGQHLGSTVINEAEKWIAELGSRSLAMPISESTAAWRQLGFTKNSVINEWTMRLSKAGVLTV